MMEMLRRSAVFAAYQLTVLLGIVLLPLAVMARRFGVTLPIGRMVTQMDETYERVAR